ncbi:MAG: hypothetical protein AABX70_05485 [Nanoarchaeota archaeon]
MQTIGLIGLGRNYHHSVGYSLGRQLFEALIEKGIARRILVNSRTRLSVEAFFEQGIKDVLEQHVHEPEWEARFSYSKKRSTQPVEKIVSETLWSADYERMSQESDLVIICLEASLSTVNITPGLARQPDLRRKLYSMNHLELQKIAPHFKDYKGMVWMVTNPPGWLCMDFYETTRMQTDQIIGIHPETHRLRDFTGLYRYLQHEGMEVHDVQGLDTLYVLGDHGGGDMVVPLSSLVAQGRTSSRFDVRLIKKGIVHYVNQLASETLQVRKSTSHEIAALVNRMVRSYSLEDEEEYVMAVYAPYLGHGKAVFSGEPAVFRNGRVEAKALDFLNEDEKREYEGCLERMRKAWEGRGQATSLTMVRKPGFIPDLYRSGQSRAEQGEWLRPPLFLAE